MSAAGAAMFARFAFPPNELGYCGPAASAVLLEHAATTTGPPASTVAALARQFEGAWPYLELLAAASGSSDPLAVEVVEAYWIGNDLSGRVRPTVWGSHLTERFARHAGTGLGQMEAAVEAGAFACHAFHVFSVYPWVGLLRGGVATAEPLHVVDRCRIRWGSVLAMDGDFATVESRPLEWDAGRLRLGDPLTERVHSSEDGLMLSGGVGVGDVVALHWDWICQPLSTRQLAWLRHVTAVELSRATALDR